MFNVWNVTLPYELQPTQNIIQSLEDALKMSLSSQLAVTLVHW